MKRLRLHNWSSYYASTILLMVLGFFWWQHPQPWQRDLVAQSTTANTSAIDCQVDHSIPSPSLVGLNSVVKMRCTERERILTSNAIPDHVIGNFPRPGNPNRVKEQQVSFNMPLLPVMKHGSAMRVRVAGYTRSGLKLEPETAETYQNTNNGWRYEAIQTPLLYDLGLDENLGHVQPTGEYHYHGVPKKYLEQLQARSKRPSVEAQMLLVAWALDGYPIYARYGYEKASDSSSSIKLVRPNYRLKTSAEIDATLAGGQSRPAVTLSEERRGRAMVASLPLGMFTQDWVYDASLGGDLDECNGRFGVTPEFPQGIYHYFLTDSYPFMQRCVKGEARETRPQGPPPGGGSFGSRPPGSGPPSNRPPPPGFGGGPSPL